MGLNMLITVFLKILNRGFTVSKSVQREISAIEKCDRRYTTSLTLFLPVPKGLINLLEG